MLSVVNLIIISQLRIQTLLAQFLGHVQDPRLGKSCSKCLNQELKVLGWMEQELLGATPARGCSKGPEGKMSA